MRIQSASDERTLRCGFKEHKPGRPGPTVIDPDLPQFGFTVAQNGTKIFFVRALRPIAAPKTIPDTVDGLTWWPTSISSTHPRPKRSRAWRTS